MHLRAAGVVLYLKNSTDNTAQSVTFDLDGELTNTTKITGNTLINAEIRSSADINADNYVGAKIEKLLHANNGIW